jgi:hypothetical protein
MGHHHEHDHSGKEGALSFPEKAHKLIDHWIHHNNEHAGTYRRWAGEFRQHHLEEAAQALETAADMTVRIEQVLRDAAAKIDAGKH